MLLDTLKYIATDLNDFLKRKFDLDEDSVILGNIVDQNGAIPESNRNKVILTLISLEPESVIKHSNYQTVGGQALKLSPPLAFNLNIMFSGLFDQYEESLKFLSQTLWFLQAKSNYNAENSPGLHKDIRAFSLEVIKLSSSETYNLWASLGTKYVPSVPFKLRLVAFQSDQIGEILTATQQMGMEALPEV